MLQVDSGREWRGGQNQVRLLCRELARRPDVELVLVTDERRTLAQRARADGVRVRGVRWTVSLDPRAAAAIAGELVSFRPHVVHAHDSHALRLALLVAKEPRRRLTVGGLVRRALGVPTGASAIRPIVVATRRVDFPVRRAGLWSRPDHVIAISKAVRAVLVGAGIAPRGITVVPSGIDPDEVRHAAATPRGIRARLGLPDHVPIAVNVAALVDHKDQMTLVRAAATARALRPDLHWAIAGEGELRGALQAEIARHRLTDRVHLLGYVADADALIAEATVFVMSSKLEGLGSVLLDALALEKPVVATAAGGIPEVLPASALVPVGDHEALGRRVADAIARPLAPCPLPLRFTADAMAAGVLAVYRLLV